MHAGLRAQLAIAIPTLGRVSVRPSIWL